MKGIYYRSPDLNVIWALNHAQNPIKRPDINRITKSAYSQIISEKYQNDTQLIILSSSSGSIIAAQTACYLADQNANKTLFEKPFHLVMGTTIISKDSELFQKLLFYQKEGLIGTIIFDELQDPGDNSSGIGVRSRFEAWLDAARIMFPSLSTKVKGPSFLNIHHETGHLHRKRSQTVQKAKDFIDVIMIHNKLAGEDYMKKAMSVIGK